MENYEVFRHQITAMISIYNHISTLIDLLFFPGCQGDISCLGITQFGTLYLPAVLHSRG